MDCTRVLYKGALLHVYFREKEEGIPQRFALPDRLQLRGLEEPSFHEFVAKEGCSDDRCIRAEQKRVWDRESGDFFLLGTISDFAVVVIVQSRHDSILPVNCMGPWKDTDILL